MEAARIGSRKQVKKLFKSQQIVIDGQPAQSLSQIVDPELQTIHVSGKKVALEGSAYYLLHKPVRVVSTASDENNRKTVVEMIPSDYRLYPVGRLDFSTR